jgi:hypothetical protein
MVEFAFVGPVFFVLLFVVFEVSYDAFNQAVLDSAVQSTARLMQIGATNATVGTAATNEALLASKYFCPNAPSFNCNDVFLRVESIDTSPASSCPGGAGKADLYDATSGNLPGGGGNNLGLGLFGGTGGNSGPTACQRANSTSGFCIPGPGYTYVNNGQQIQEHELIILSAVYVAPSFLQGLVLNTIKYGGHYVRAQYSDAAFVPEGFTPAVPATC